MRDFKLNALLEITMAINENRPTADLLELYSRVLKNDLDIQKLLLFTEEQSWKCLLKYGIAGEIRDITDEDFFNQSGDISTFVNEESFEIVIPVYHDEEPIAYLLVGDVEDGIGTSPAIKHMQFIQTLTNVILVAIKNKNLVEESLRQERMKRELELAAEMQSLLVPSELSKKDSIEVSAVYKPHQQVGGDYYDYLELNEDETMFCMADVSGKGISAAFLMSNFQAYLKAIFSYKEFTLKEVIVELNKRVMNSAMGEKYITLFIAIYNNKTRKLQSINCGHNPPILANLKGETKLLQKGGIGLGMFEKFPSLEEEINDIDVNSILVCYTDGLIEIENSDNEEMGMDRLTRMVLEYKDLSMPEFNQNIMNEASYFKGDMPYVDDTALMSFRFK